MSRRYDDAGVSILKPSVSPTLTLIWVAKPWMLLLPAPVIPHSLSGLPGLVFSQATGLTTGASHGAATAAGGATTLSPATTSAPTAAMTQVLDRGIRQMLCRSASMVGLARSGPRATGPRASDLARYGRPGS